MIDVAIVFLPLIGALYRRAFRPQFIGDRLAQSRDLRPDADCRCVLAILLFFDVMLRRRCDRTDRASSPGSMPAGFEASWAIRVDSLTR